MRKNKVRKWGVAKILAVVLLGLLILFFLFFSEDIFAIEQIIIKGNSQVSTEDVAILNGYQEKDILWKVNARLAESRIKSHVLIKDALVVRKLPDVLTIEVGERTPVLYIYSDERFVVLDDEGIAIRIERSKPPEEIPFFLAADIMERVYLGQKITEKNTQKVLSFLDKMTVEDLSYVYEIIPGPITWTIYTEQGWEVLLGSEEQLETKMTLMRSLLYESDLLEKVPEMVSLDLSNPERPLIKYE